jgi:hypothetical protein
VVLGWVQGPGGDFPEAPRQADTSLDSQTIVGGQLENDPAGAVTTVPYCDGVRLDAAGDPGLSQALHERAEREGRTNSELNRDALRWYLQAS